MFGRILGGAPRGGTELEGKADGPHHRGADAVSPLYIEAYAFVLSRRLRLGRCGKSVAGEFDGSTSIVGGWVENFNAHYRTVPRGVSGDDSTVRHQD